MAAYTAVQGYVLGLEEQLDYLPYSLYLTDTRLYAGDLFIQTLSQQVVHERTLGGQLLAIWAPHLEAGTLALHMLTGWLLAWGVLRVALQVVGASWRAYAATLLTFTALQTVYWDATELLNNNWQGDAVAMACGFWALDSLLRQRPLHVVALLLVVGTWLHPLVGLLWAVWLATAILSLRPRPCWRQMLLASIVYALLAGSYLGLLWWSKQGAAVPGHFAHYYQFRAGHHFMPDQFSRKGWVVMAMAVVLGWVWLRGIPQRMVQLFVLGSVVYGSLVAMLQSSGVAQFQVYRLSPVVECLGLLALASRVPQQWLPRVAGWAPTLAIIALVGLGGFLAIWPRYTTYPYHYHAANLAANPQVQLGHTLARVLPPGAVVLHPLRWDGHKYFGRASSYLEYKSIPRTQAGFAIWHKRLRQVYGPATGQPHFWQQADSLYPLRVAAVLDSLPHWGITHVLMPAQTIPLPLPLQASTAFARIYQTAHKK